MTRLQSKSAGGYAIPGQGEMPKDLAAMLARAGAAKPVMAAERLSAKDFTKTRAKPRTGHRPEWLAQEPSPRTSMHALPSALKVALAEGKLPSQMSTKLLTLAINSQAYPWSTIGKILIGYGDGSDPCGQAVGLASGVLVGPNLVLTAGHAVPWDRKPGDWWMRFMPAFYFDAFPGSSFFDQCQRYVYNEPLGGSFVEQCYGFLGDEDDVEGDDMAICKLYDPIGKATGWMGWHAYSKSGSYKDRIYASAGYPLAINGGNIMSLEALVFIDDVDGGANGGLELETAPFTSGGWSGGPLFSYVDGGPRVFGICEGTETEFSLFDWFVADHSVFVGGDLLLDLVGYGWANWT